MENQFIAASRLKLRFEAGKGLVTAEELWALPLTKINEMAVAVNKVVTSSTESFLDEDTVKNSKEAKEANLKLDILKYIITTRQAETKAKTQAAERSQEAATLKNLLATKKLEALGNLSEAELEKRIADLGV